MTELKQDENWYDTLPSCRGLHELFDFDGKWKTHNSNETNMMRKICASCPVINECLEDTLRYGDVHTFRAGMLPSERLRLMRKLGLKTWDEKQEEFRKERAKRVHGFGKQAWSEGCKCKKCKFEHDIKKLAESV
jgi:hypothetical protein